MNKHSQKCPICNRKVERNPLFPNYVCNACQAEATDEQGEPVVFYHARFNENGLQGYYRRHQELVPFKGTYCYVHGVKCQAVYNQFEGILLLPAYDPFEERKTNVMPGATRYKNIKL